MIEKSEVLEAAKELNELKLSDKKIKTTATTVELLKEAFMEAIEAIPEKDEKKIPKKVAKLYNDLVEESEEEVIEESEEVKPKKKSNAKKAPEEEIEEIIEEGDEEARGKDKKTESEPEEEEEEVKPKKNGKPFEKNKTKKTSEKRVSGTQIILTAIKDSGKSGITLEEVIKISKKEGLESTSGVEKRVTSLINYFVKTDKIEKKGDKYCAKK